MIEEIRQRIALGQFEFSLHATNQSIARKIPVSEIREMILAAEIIEDYPDDKYGPSLLLLGFTKAGRPLHLHLSTPARPMTSVICLRNSAFRSGP